MFILKVIGRDDILKDGIAWVGPYETQDLAQNGADRIESCNPDDYSATILDVNDDMPNEYAILGVDKNGQMYGNLPGEFLSEFYFTHCF